MALEELGQTGFAFALQLLRRHDDAADVVQDCLQRLLDKPNRYDAKRGPLRGFFLKMVRHRCLDVLRQRQRQPISSDETIRMADSSTPHPDQAAERHEMQALLRRELEGLPAEQSEIILLRDFHDLSYAEISNVLSIPRGTVMSRLHRARANLGRRMQRYG
jgi:RNA polymerase sigma-70 factor (ECF subfamily)